MSININSSMFDLLFFIVILLFGLDFTLSGVLAIKNLERNINKPFLLGLWMMKRVTSINPFKGQNNFMSWLYSTKVLIFSLLTGGVLTVLMSVTMVINILLTKTLFSLS